MNDFLNAHRQDEGMIIDMLRAKLPGWHWTSWRYYMIGEEWQYYGISKVGVLGRLVELWPDSSGVWYAHEHEGDSVTFDDFLKREGA